MEEKKDIINTGLRGVTVASTKISDIDSTIGRLIYRGYLAKDLAQNATFEETAYLLLYEKLPDAQELERFKKRLSNERSIPPEIHTALRTRPKTSLPMDILQAGTAMLANHDLNLADTSRETGQHRAIRLIAGLPSLLAAWDRIRNDLEPIAPLPDLDHAANFLYMLTGKEPDEEISRFFGVCLILHAEHSLNASTFAAREVASTRAHMFAAVAAAIGSLSGELHGGANVRVMEMLQKIGSVDQVEAFVHREMDEGRKLFGLGHAVYKVDDPRAHILAPMSRIMGEKAGEPRWYEISTVLERKGKEIFKQRKGIDIFVNVDFYSASLYYTMGIPIDFFTPVFAISRIAGWTAHILEEQFADAAEKPALYRPSSDYVGEYCGPDQCSFVPLESR